MADTGRMLEDRDEKALEMRYETIIFLKNSTRVMGEHVLLVLYILRQPNFDTDIKPING